MPDELLAAVEGLGDVNLSEVLQDGLRARLGCRHDELACRACAAPLDRRRLIDKPLGDFYSDALWALGELVSKLGTAEGAARVLKAVAERHRVPDVDRLPLPRPTRSQREAAAEPGARGRNGSAEGPTSSLDRLRGVLGATHPRG